MPFKGCTKIPLHWTRRSQCRGLYSLSGAIRASICVLALFLISQVSASAPAFAQDLQDSPIEISYVEPSNPSFRPIYDDLKRRRVLEELQQFISPLRLPRKILVKTDECGRDTVIYERGKPITICYEYVARIVALAPEVQTPKGISRENAIIGAFAQSVLHQVSLATFDILNIPVWGRVEDAADKVTAYVMLQFSKDLAVRMIAGATWFFEASKRTWTGSDFASATSPQIQRFYNYLCIAYGGNPDAFRSNLTYEFLDTARAVRCTNEYRDLDDAFKKTILPHIDPVRLEMVRSMEWARPKNEAR